MSNEYSPAFYDYRELPQPALIDEGVELDNKLYQRQYEMAHDPTVRPFALRHPPGTQDTYSPSSDLEPWQCQRQAMDDANIARLLQQYAAVLEKNVRLLDTVQKQSEHNNMMVDHIARYFKPLNDSLEKVAKELAWSRQISIDEAREEMAHRVKRWQQQIRRRGSRKPTTPLATPSATPHQRR